MHLKTDKSANLYVNVVKEIDNKIKIEFEYIYKNKLNSNEFKEALIN